MIRTIPNSVPIYWRSSFIRKVTFSSYLAFVYLTKNDTELSSQFNLTMPSLTIIEESILNDPGKEGFQLIGEKFRKKELKRGKKQKATSFQ